MIRASRILLPFLVVLLGLPAPGAGRPERIRPGVSFYSDDFVLQGDVYDLGEEKNYEEVYQFYRYYEAIYDAEGRVAVFKEYRRGELVRAEEYVYGGAGNLVEKVLTRPGEPAQVIRIDPTEDRP